MLYNCDVEVMNLLVDILMMVVAVDKEDDDNAVDDG